MRTSIPIVMLLAACAKKDAGDECQQLVDKSKSVLDAMSVEIGKPFSDDDRARFIAKCRDQHGKPGNKDDGMMKCVLDAKGDDAVKACWAAAMGDYMKKGKKTEAQLQLNKLSKLLKVAYVTNSAFPIGKTGPTPDKGCCGQPVGKCAVTDAWTTDKTWSALGFDIAEPNLFQYSYESDGKTATATAVGDLDCDTTMITYKLDAHVENGNPVTNIVEPPANSD